MKSRGFDIALNNLQEIYNYKEPYDNVVMIGMVKLYEICFEQSWKAIKELLDENGTPEGKTGSPKLILKTAYQMGMIQDKQLWLEALQARNNVAHAYNKAVALDIINSAKQSYYDMFCRLKNEMEQNWI